MRRKTSRRIRIVVLFLAACIVALVTGSAIALATSGGGDHDGGDHGGGGGSSTTARPPDPCTLKIVKSLDHDAPDGTKYSDFSVQVEYPDGAKSTKSFSNSSGHSASFSLTAAGDYKVTEVSIPKGFAPSYSAQTVTFSAADISKGGVTKTVTITNGYSAPPKPCTLKVVKVLSDAPHDTAYDEFSVEVAYPGGTKLTKSFSNSGSHSASFSVTEAGDHSITEVSIPTGFTPTYSAQSVTFSPEDIAKGDVTKTVTITNSYTKPGPSTGSVNWNGVNGADLNCEYGGNLHWILHSGGSGDITGGTLHVVFVGGGTGDFTGYFPGGGDGALHFNSIGTAKVQSASATYTYTGCVDNVGLTISSSTCNAPPPKLGSIKVHKTVSGKQPADDILGPEAFSVTVKNSANETVGQGSFDANGDVVFSGLVVGDYVVSEDYPGDAWNVTMDPANGAVTVVADATVQVNVTNQRKLGSLLIKKTITGDQPADKVWKYEDFTVVVTGPATSIDPSSNVFFNGPFDAAGEILIEGLLPGTYTVTEEAPGYPWQVSGNGTVVVVSDQEAQKAITNTGSTSTTLAPVTTAPTGTSIAGTVTTLRSTRTTPTTTGDTVLGFSSTSDTVLGWVAEPGSIQTGGGGTAGNLRGAWISLGLAGLMLIAVIVVSAVGVRRGTF